MRGSMTSTPMPSRSKSLAASRAVLTIAKVAIKVTSAPSLFTSATPNGIVYSSSGTGPRILYSSLCSRNITGFPSLTAVLNNPFPSDGLDGATTFSPGVCMKMASGLEE